MVAVRSRCVFLRMLAKQCSTLLMMTKSRIASAKIFIVEDDEFLSDAYDTILRHKGYQTEVFGDGAEVLSRLESEVPDLILLDLRLPEVGGLEVLESLQRKGHSTSTIVLSNHSVRNEIDKAFSLGVSRYIVKSWTSPKELVDIVAAALKGAH